VAIASNRHFKASALVEPWQLGELDAPPPRLLVETARCEPYLVWVIGNYIASLPKDHPHVSIGMHALHAECGETGEIFAHVLSSREHRKIRRLYRLNDGDRRVQAKGSS
jgi:hypothetical protein